MEPKQILILGVGNLLFTDEGVGVRVAESLQDRYEFSDNVKVVDGGTLGMNLLGVVSGVDHLIVVDAVKNGRAPGTLYRLAGEEIPKRILAKNSLHQVDLLEALTCCQALDKVPETVILGVEPEDITTLGIDMTPTVRARIDDLIQAALKELIRLGGSYCSKKEGDSCMDSEFVRRI
ncbi:MAG: HyaD/HybD family hydrogenase maturation endopeptidase [Deltaproteobacteria bacterium]|nr:MAG: HyaD/HybD family hydrogenase maturation endopeptidase [Deltaproteobacteria bacterium]